MLVDGGSITRGPNTWVTPPLPHLRSLLRMRYPPRTRYTEDATSRLDVHTLATIDEIFGAGTGTASVSSAILRQTGLRRVQEVPGPVWKLVSRLQSADPDYHLGVTAAARFRVRISTC